MKIGSPSDSRVPAAPTGNGRSTNRAEGGRTPAAAPSSGAGSPSVVVSRTLTETAASDPDVNTEKVNSVRTAIQNGSYKVDAGAIADKLLSNAQEMLNRSRS